MIEQWDIDLTFTSTTISIDASLSTRKRSIPTSKSSSEILSVLTTTTIFTIFYTINLDIKTSDKTHFSVKTKITTTTHHGISQTPEHVKDVTKGINNGSRIPTIQINLTVTIIIFFLNNYFQAIARYNFFFPPLYRNQIIYFK